MDSRFQVVLENWEEGAWNGNEQEFRFKKENAEKIDLLSNRYGKFVMNDSLEFYEITDEYIEMLFSFLLTGAKNFKYYTDFISSGEKVNKNGYGLGIVYENFNFADSIEIV